MKIYLVETPTSELGKSRDQWALKRAVVVAINEEGAVNCVTRAVRGERVFVGTCDEGRYSRPNDRPSFDPDAAEVTEVGEALPGNKGTRILAWEIVPPDDTAGEESDSY